MATNGKYLPAEERRAVIVETVLTLAAEGNPSEITTAAIAERMGLTQGALFAISPEGSNLEAVMAWAARTLARDWRRRQQPLRRLGCPGSCFLAYRLIANTLVCREFSSANCSAPLTVRPGNWRWSSCNITGHGSGPSSEKARQPGSFHRYLTPTLQRVFSWG